MLPAAHRRRKTHPRSIFATSAWSGSPSPWSPRDASPCFADHRKMMIHMDAVRLWNACVATGITPSEYCRDVDTVSVCMAERVGCTGRLRPGGFRGSYTDSASLPNVVRRLSMQCTKQGTLPRPRFGLRNRPLPFALSAHRL
ncbi:beta-eliminating lyase-related protein [Bradyrhizobium sp. USDA 4011]